MQPPVARQLAVRHLSTASFLATDGFKFLIISKCMVYKHAVVAEFHIYAQGCEDAAKRGGWRSCIKKHGNYIVDHGKPWKNHGIVFLNFCGNPGSEQGLF